MGIKFRHSASFGRRMEYWLIGQMLREGLDVYVPLVDDFGVDAVVRKQDNQFIDIQIKARALLDEIVLAAENLQRVKSKAEHLAVASVPNQHFACREKASADAHDEQPTAAVFAIHPPSSDAE